MKLFFRIGYYLFGFTIGLFLLSIIFKGKKTSCNYSPNDRVINDLSKKKWNSILEKKIYIRLNFVSYLSKDG